MKRRSEIPDETNQEGRKIQGKSARNGRRNIGRRSTHEKHAKGISGRSLQKGKEKTVVSKKKKGGTCLQQNSLAADGEEEKGGSWNVQVRHHGKVESGRGEQEPSSCTQGRRLGKIKAQFLGLEYAKKKPELKKTD